MQKGRRVMRTKEQAVAAFNGMRPSEVAEELNCSREHVVALIKNGSLDAVDIAVGSRPEYRVPRESFDAFLAARAVA